MKNYTIRDLNTSKPKICKQLLSIGNKYLTFIDESIIKKLGITEDSIIFLEQEVLPDNTILMRIKKF
jgi:hypothetical protein